MPLTLADFIDETAGVTLNDIPDEEEERINQTLEDLTQGLGEEPSGGPVSADVLVSKTLNDRQGFETIQDALDGTNPVNGASGAEAGDTIRIESGEFNEAVSVSKQGISLVGDGEEQTTIAGQVDVTATGFTLQGTTVRADVGVTDDTAVLIDDGTGATIENNTIIAREEGLALQVKQAPSSGVAAIETNTFQPLGNETAESLVVIGSNGSGSTAESIVMTDGGEPMSLETQTNQPQASDQPSVQVVDNAFIGNISGQGAVVVESESDIQVAAEQNDFSEALLFDDDADLVSNQSTAANVTTSGNIEPEPVSQGEGIEIPGDGDVRTADFTDDGNLPNLSVSRAARTLTPTQDEPDGEIFVVGLQVPTVIDGDAPDTAFGNEQVVTGNETGLQFGSGTATGTEFVVVPTNVNSGGNNQQTFDIPATLIWQSSLSDEDFGSNTASISVGSTGETLVGFNTPDPIELNQANGKEDFTLKVTYAPESLAGGDVINTPLSAENLTVTLEIDIDQASELGQEIGEDLLSETTEYAVPVSTLLNIQDVLDDVSDRYSTEIQNAASVFLKAPKTEKTLIPATRKSARLLLYAKVAQDDDLADDQLVVGAALNGIGAFTAQAAKFNELLSDDFLKSDQEVGPGGPSIYRDTRPPESSTGEIKITDARFIGDDRSGGLFQFTPTGENLAVPVTIGTGVILSTGKVNDVVGPNDSSRNRTITTGGSDPDLDALSTIDGNTFDAASLELDLAVPSNVTEISFRHVFGSEEYNEFTGSEFNDVFAFFVGEGSEKTNEATVPNPNKKDERVAASINNVNHGNSGTDSVSQTDPSNPQLFINNDPHDGELVTVNPQNPPGPGIGFDPSNTTTGGEPFPFEMDGFTVPLEITAPVDPGETNSIKIAIADVGDAIYDSWVIVAAADITATTGSNTA